MKKAFLILCLFPILLTAQISPTVTTEVDEFTGEKMSFNFAEYSKNLKSVFMFVYSEEYGTILYLSVRSPWSYNYALEGSEFYLKLENEEVIKLKSIGQAELNEYTVDANFMLSQEQLKQLASIKVEKCRMSTDKGYLEFKDKKTKGKNQLLLAAKNMLAFTELEE